MFEIPFHNPKHGDPFDPAEAKPVADRLRELATVAQKLSKMKWSVTWTVTGLAFSPERPRDANAVAVRHALDGLNVSEDFRPRAARTFLNILVDRLKYRDRVAYAEAEKTIRAISAEGQEEFWYDFGSDRCVRESIQEMMRIEATYRRSELVVGSDYARGVLQGRLQALEWLLGQEWPELVDTEDELEAEMLEEDRDLEIQERALATLGAVLFENEEESATAAQQSFPPEGRDADGPTENADGAQA